MMVMVLAMVAGCAGMTVEQQELTEFAIESAAMLIGYELRAAFEWSDDAEKYYQWIMAGHISLEGAKVAEKYLSGVTHPVIANRAVRLAAMVGFDLDAAGSIVGVGNVDVPMLQAAARGFRVGLDLD